MEGAYEDRENLRDFLEEAELEQYHELFRDILKVSKVSQLKFVLTEDLSHIGLSKPEQRRYKKVYSKYFPNPYITKIKKLLTSKRNDAYTQGQGALSIEFTPFNENNVKVPTKHIISVEDISINKELGMGQFGVVQQGTWTTGNQRLQVAIKCLGHERMTSNSTEFLKEAAVMHSIEHPNIVRLYGVVLHLDSLMLVTELAPLRSLLECLREVSLRPNFPVPNLCEFAEQICAGMTYLENKRLIHRDLAARNILVFNKDRVKISDFGLSRALGVGKDYYQTNYNVNLKLPVAWCAPECILYLRFTPASDVWAFGVCLWEMFTYGFQPWAAFSGQQILEAIDAPNYHRLERPECCPEPYYMTMLECWSHDPNSRPKFKDLEGRFREIRPEQVQATEDFRKPEEARRNNYLDYKSGQIITVLGKEESSKLWYGVLPGGACGVFDPNNTKPYVKTPKSSLSPRVGCSLGGSRGSALLSSTIRPSSLLRSDVKRHTYTGKRTIQRNMISSPQGDVKHTGHVGLDGAYFGDISFLDPAGCTPRQVVTPYKPSEDLEQVPLINPNSPSHLTADPSTPAYPLLRSADTNAGSIDAENSIDLKSKSSIGKKNQIKLISEPTTSKSILNKVKCATLGRSFKSDEGGSGAPKEEVHEYHEISDTDTDSNTDNLVLPISPSSPKHYGDFSKCMLDEMEALFRSLDSRETDAGCSQAPENDTTVRYHTLSKADKKKGSNSGTMKPMSAHDKKTLDTAVAMANELTTRSMNDLDDVQKVPPSPGEKSKFHFKFPLVSSLHHSASAPDPEPRESSTKPERRNFSKEANSVPNIQESLTEESKKAYTSLIEDPVKRTSLISHIAQEGQAKPATMPKPTPKIVIESPQLNSLRQSRRHNSDTHYEVFLPSTSKLPFSASTFVIDDEAIWRYRNNLPLPNRDAKPKLIDKPRHVRKHPLLSLELSPPPVTMPKPNLNIYQNFGTCQAEAKAEIEMQYLNLDSQKEVDTVDGAVKETNTNPFSVTKAVVNPFVDSPDDEEPVAGPSVPYFEEGALLKDCTDHVSVEDLLEFADQKPHGRERGVESDEVRIMAKVLKNEAIPETCLEALELAEWNVHYAIKIVRVRRTTRDVVSLEVCSRYLAAAKGDVVKSAYAIAKQLHNNN